MQDNNASASSVLFADFDLDLGDIGGPLFWLPPADTSLLDHEKSPPGIAQGNGALERASARDPSSEDDPHPEIPDTVMELMG